MQNLFYSQTSYHLIKKHLQVQETKYTFYKISHKIKGFQFDAGHKVRILLHINNIIRFKTTT